MKDDEMMGALTQALKDALKPAITEAVEAAFAARMGRVSESEKTTAKSAFDFAAPGGGVTESFC